MYIITGGITSLILTAYRLYTVPVFESLIAPCWPMTCLRLLVVGLSRDVLSDCGYFGRLGHWNRFIVGRGALRRGFLRKLLRLSPVSILILHVESSVIIVCL